MTTRADIGRSNPKQVIHIQESNPREMSLTRKDLYLIVATICAYSAVHGSRYSVLETTPILFGNVWTFVKSTRFCLAFNTSVIGTYNLYSSTPLYAFNVHLVLTLFLGALLIVLTGTRQFHEGMLVNVNSPELWKNIEMSTVVATLTPPIVCECIILPVYFMYQLLSAKCDIQV